MVTTGDPPFWEPRRRQGHGTPLRNATLLTSLLKLSNEILSPPSGLQNLGLDVEDRSKHDNTSMYKVVPQLVYKPHYRPP